MMKKLLIPFVLLLTTWSEAWAQLIACQPVFPGPDETVTITFNAAEGNRGLVNFTGDIYAHTGIITSASTSASDWKNVKATWETNLPECKMTRSATNPNLYTLTFNIRTFYNYPAGTIVRRLAFVFRSADRTRTGKTTDNGDIFYDVYAPGSALKTLIITPTGTNILSSTGATIAFRGAASLNSTLTLTDNGAVIASASNAKELVHNIAATTSGSHTVVFKAVSDNQADSSSFTYTVANQVVTANPPAGSVLGATANTRGDSVTFVLQAPNKQSVFVMGSFNDYRIENAYLMNKSVDGKTWWLKVGGFTPGQTYTYQYFIDGTITIADPLSTVVLDPNNDASVPAVTYPNRPAYPTGKTTGFVSVLEPGKAPYVWRATNWQRPPKSDLIIYELLVRDFVTRHDYQTLIDSINYLKRLGINAVQLMPVQEFDSNESWGYNPTFHMALDKYYGTVDKFKEFIDVCHQNGIAVIIDVVYNHIWETSSLAKMYPLNAHPYLNATATHPFSVGIDMNHESEFTRNYVERCLTYWLNEYKVDGFRFDLSKGFTQRNTGSDVGAWSGYDQSRIDILKRYNNTVKSVTPDAYVIMEHFADNSEETVLANEGMMLWGNMNHNYNQATMGYDGNGFSGISSKSRNWRSAANNSALVGYMESHDEERLMYKNLLFGNVAVGTNYSVKSLNTALARMEAASAFLYTVQGPKMLWQFGEIGYDYTINFNCRVCNKPIRWDYLQDPNRLRLYNATRNIIALRTQNPEAFRNLEYNELELNAEFLKAFHINAPELKMTILGNFNVVAGDVNPGFQNTGTWYDYMTGDSITVNNTTATFRLLPGEYRIYTSKRLPTPPAGYLRYTNSTQAFAEQVNAFTVYPNPASAGQAFVGYNLKKGGDVQWSVFNLQGQQVAQSAVVNMVAGSYEEPLTAPLTAGTYLVRLTVNGATATQKLIVE